MRHEYDEMRFKRVCECDETTQFFIALALCNAGVSPEDFNRAMNSRLCDLEDTIDVRRCC